LLIANPPKIKDVGAEDLIEAELTLSRFRRLINELGRGSPTP
jgi:hypothetical protein